MAGTAVCGIAAPCCSCSSPAWDSSFADDAFGSKGCPQARTRGVGFQDAICCVRASGKKQTRKKVKLQRPYMVETASSSRDAVKDSPRLMDSSSARPEVRGDGDAGQGAGNVEKPLETSLPAASREDVIRACVSTSAGIAAAGLLLRQGSHWAAEAGFNVPDCTAILPYTIDESQLGAVTVMVLLVSSVRQLLLRLWPDFRQASRLSNQQVLGPLEPLDYVLVSALPGISEEVLFRGALLPLVGVDWYGAAAAGLLFGALHRSGGRNTAFAVWASAVGMFYGVGSVATQSLAVPMAAHSLANLVSIGLWRLDKDT